MTQMNLDRQVAKLTGESVATIRRMGFQVACQPLVAYDPEPFADQLDDEPATVDWDQLDAERVSYFPERRRQVAA